MNRVLADVADDIADRIGSGRVADYIPALASVDPHRFGMAVALPDGTSYGVGDWQTPVFPEERGLRWHPGDLPWALLDRGVGAGSG